MTAAALVAALAAALVSGLAAALVGRVALVAGRAVARVLGCSCRAGAGARRRPGGRRRRARGAVGFDPADGLYWLYALLPVAVSFVAEQLRVASAETVLDARGLENAAGGGRARRGRASARSCSRSCAARWA